MKCCSPSKPLSVLTFRENTICRFPLTNELYDCYICAHLLCNISYIRLSLPKVEYGRQSGVAVSCRSLTGP
uniref:Uncharacterized protein n=1 Tax=Pararge aegeria TaxID=116150 RepID=S4NIP8_9NEOP